jgi:hypothetical protein
LVPGRCWLAGARVDDVKITHDNQIPQPGLTVRGDVGDGLDELVAENSP